MELKIQPSEIEKILNTDDYKHLRIDDDLGWTGEWRISAKNIIDLLIDLNASPLLLDRISDSVIKKEMNKHLETLPYAGGYPSDWRETLSKHLGDWLRDRLDSANLTKDEINTLHTIRHYFGEHDKTPFEHQAYSFLYNLLTRLSLGSATSKGESSKCIVCGISTAENGKYCYIHEQSK